MAKKLLVVVTLILVGTMVLSACAKSDVKDLPIITQSPTIIVTSTPTATMTPFPTPIPEDITNAISAQATGTNTVELSNLSMNRTMRVYRRFTTEVDIVTNLAPGETFTDNLAWDGSEYYYWGEDDWGNRTSEAKAVTDLAEITKQRGLFYKWETVARRYGNYYDIPTDAAVYSYLLHGVKVSTIYEKAIADQLSDNQMEQYALTVAGLFNKQWQLYEGFPLDEYRQLWTEKLFKGHGEFTTGTVTQPYWLFGTSGSGLSQIDNMSMHKGTEDIAHGIGHAWQGPAIETQSHGLREGMNQYSGRVTGLPAEMYLGNNRILNNEFSPLPIDPDGFDLPIWVYIKGDNFIYKLSVKLLDEAGLNIQQFYKYYYDTFFLNQNRSGGVFTQGTVSTQRLLQALNDFSGLDFTDLFDDDVYEKVDLDVEYQMDSKYLPVFRAADGEPIDTINSSHYYEIMSFQSPMDGMKMIYIPAGEFHMGIPSGPANLYDAKPEHLVALDHFWIDQTEITNAMYEECVSDGGCTAPSDKSSATREQYFENPEFANYPVVNVNWEQASAYCEWAGKRLPTEAEWEKTIRGVSWNEYKWGNDFFYLDQANIRINPDTIQVGSYSNSLSTYGAMDMVGNVWEWVADWYDSEYYQNSPATNPYGPNTGEKRVTRGGNWESGDIYPFSRGNEDPNTISNTIGFRCASSQQIGQSTNPVFRSTITPTVTITPGPSPTPSPSPTNTPTPIPGAIEIRSQISPIDGMELMYIAEGEFTMGGKQTPQEHIQNNPLHQVYLDAFWIDKTEVTYKMYKECVKAGACPIEMYNYDNTIDNNLPIVFVGWYMARDYCRWAGRDLPTNAQWEKAAFGIDGRKYPWGNQKPDDNLLSFRWDQPVGSFPAGASPYGVLDMAGSAREWVSDWFYGPLPAEAAINPTGPVTGLTKANREVLGIGQPHPREFLDWVSIEIGSYDTGFRCVLNTTKIPEATPLPTISDKGVPAQKDFIISTSDKMILINIPAGDFWFGDEPYQKAFLESYWIDQIEVTNSMYSLCVKDGACTEPTVTQLDAWGIDFYFGNPEFAELAVAPVTANQAKTYCEWAGRRLPTEQEWEKAARGTDARLYPWGNTQPGEWINNETAEDDLPDVSPYGVTNLSLNGVADEWTSSTFPEYDLGNHRWWTIPGEMTIVKGLAPPAPLFARAGFPATELPHWAIANPTFRCAVDDSTINQENHSYLIPTPIPTSTPRPIFDYVTSLDDVEMVNIPGGDFYFGFWKKKISINEFWIDQTEVSNSQYEKCVAQKKCTPPQDRSSQTNDIYYGNPLFSNFPVINITFKQANEYCTWAGKYLPTEAEWEKAARGTDARYYPWGDDINDSPANSNNEVGDTTSVSSYPEGASPYGALNMAGNVWEYTTDLYQPEVSSSVYAVRGGSWDNLQLSLLERSDMGENDISPSVGFRCISLQP